MPAPRRPFHLIRLALRPLEDRLAPAGFFAAGADAGGAPLVRIFDAVTRAEIRTITAYDAAFLGGVRVGVGDLNGDAIPDIVTGAGPGGGPHVKVFDGRDFSEIASFFAYDAAFTGGVNVAVGDIDGDGVQDLVTGAGAGGGPHVKAFTILGGVLTPVNGPLGSFFAYDAAFQGGVNVAAGNLDGQGADELVTAAESNGGPHVKAFAANGALMANFFAYDAAFTGGVNVAVGDFNADGRADISTGPGSGGGPHVRIFSGLDGSVLANLLAYDPAFTGGVRVASADLNADGRADIVTGAGPGGGPHARVFDAATLDETAGVMAFDFGFTGGIRIGSSALETAGNPAFFQLRSEVSLLDRVSRFVPNAVPSLGNWVAQPSNDTSLHGKNVYAIAHGWAPGFVDMVNAYVSNDLPNPPLKWWQTLDTALPGSPGFPASPEMFYGSSGDGVQISPAGLAYAITQSDPNAVVLAYSWIDESATSGDPLKSFLSEAYTSMNGGRLANALQTILPATFSSGGGRLHLIGHSHGSKVATVAANFLAQLNNANFAVQHLTLLDSPEDDLVTDGDAANNLWYFLAALNIDRTPGSTFVDNYISEFGEPLGVIQGRNPFTGVTTGVLQKIVDVQLNPDVLIGLTSPGDKHAYAFNWYGGASLPWAQNPTPTVANKWSPLLHSATPATLAGNYSQGWSAITDDQFALTPTGTPPNFNVVSDTPTFTDLAISSFQTSGNATYVNNVVTLTEGGVTAPQFTGVFSPKSDIAGISFNFRFSNMGAGDQLIISAGTGFAHEQQIHYVMTGTVAGTTERFATLSLGSLKDSLFDNKIQIQLVTVSGSQASVQIDNMQQFEQ
jgi:hypothetical protein